MSDFQILRNIAKHVILTNEEKDNFISSLVLKQIQKKKQVLKQGEVCNSLFFVESGSLRAFYLDNEGKESTIMFALKDWWITDMDAFVNQKSSLLTVEALTDSNIIEIDHNKLEHLYLQIPKFERFFRILFQKAYVREQSRALQNISLTTKERYLLFIKNYPAIVEKVTQKQIASYLGVTPEFLSTVKKR